VFTNICVTVYYHFCFLTEKGTVQNSQDTVTDEEEAVEEKQFPVPEPVEEKQFPVPEQCVIEE